MLRERDDPIFRLRRDSGGVPKLDTDNAVLTEMLHRLHDRADALLAAANNSSGETRFRYLEQREEVLQRIDPNAVSSSGDPVYDAWCAALDAGADGAAALKATQRAQKEMSRGG